jgi:hypothetical protein
MDEAILMLVMVADKMADNLTTVKSPILDIPKVLTYTPDIYKQDPYYFSLR